MGGGTEKRVGDTKTVKKGRQAGPRGGCLKKGGRTGTSLRTMLNIVTALISYA